MKKTERENMKFEMIDIMTYYQVNKGEEIYYLLEIVEEENSVKYGVWDENLETVDTNLKEEIMKEFLKDE